MNSTVFVNPGISAGSFVLLQGVFRRAGGLIYDFLLLSCGIRLLMFQPCLDRILICLIWSLIYYKCVSSLLLMRPTTDVSSANLMMWLELNLAVQSWVSSVKSSGLSTQPCGAPVLSVVVLEVLWPTRTD